MKRIVIIIASIIVFAVVGVCVFNHFSNKDGQSRVSNDQAQKDDDNRYLTIINETEQVINEVHITVNEGTEIEHGYQENPDETSFSIKIPSSYQECNSFTVTLIDRYGLKYQKIVSNVPNKGRTEVKVKKSDNVKQDGDWKRKLNKFANGD